MGIFSTSKMHGILCHQFMVSHKEHDFLGVPWSECFKTTLRCQTGHLRTIGLKPKHASELPRGLIKTQIAMFHPQSLWFSKCAFLTHFQVLLLAHRPHLENHWLRASFLEIMIPFIVLVAPYQIPSEICWT